MFGTKRTVAGRSPAGKRLLFAAVALLLLLAVLSAGRALAAGPPLQSQNLLENPGFEEGFYYWNGINELHLGNGWTPWWIENPEHDPTYFRPEYKHAQAAEFSNRVRSGQSAQQWFKLHSSFYAGIHQQVDDVTVGESYRFSIWAQVWSSIEDNPPDISAAPANPHLQIGIDPTGNVDPFSADIVWSYEAGMHQVIDAWSPLSVQAVARNTTITVFVRSRPDFANKHNNIYLDDASLQLVTPAPTEEPTETPLPTETPTPEPTATAIVEPVTAVPVATDTQAPPPTETPVEATLPPPPPAPTQVPPTLTAVPPSATATFLPLPSETPLPTNTVARTATPTATAVATDTAVPPTETASATPTTEPPATEVAMVSPTAAVATEPPPAAAEDASEGIGSGLRCAAPIVGIGLLGLALVIVRRRSGRLT